MRVYIGKRAHKQLNEIYEWYENEKEGLGELFFEEFENVLHTIAQQPMAGIEFRVKKRKVLVRKFPYKVFYSVSANALTILAIFHSSMNK
jgi:toxin ParE1/3/4